MPTFDTLIYEKPEAYIARIWLNRPDTRNAQDTKLLYELNDAFDTAMADDEVKVVVLAAKGPHFSAGHDLREADIVGSSTRHKRVGTWSAADWAGAEAYYCREKEIYEGFCRRWRDLAKPTIASVQGKVIAGGLMLIWPCDLVIASADATFQDNTMYMGIPGVEYFAHAWELGVRKAKEFLLTGEPLTAAEAQAAGMVNRVVARDTLEVETLALARSIANKPPFALKLAKDAINAAFHAQGFENVQRAAFNAHHLAHTHYRLHQNGSYIDSEFVRKFLTKTEPK
ncbi:MULTISPECIES: enoyl-CoA hydratase [unclassified Sphingomonas]|uniref:enoyl-CoA hydratase n=1 Tax=unclassified Sphingomonas TaxID=196159 RepID=UPI0009271564|nr:MULTISPECIES: enoyl-CoA hydratase [unclassified Sphingomonas]MBN8847124.1 enoyl-CoA hydratase [Sphingomonas sp.]OJV27471.1 MAG: enoyl-CoA hydratase [Sphingomonas sp. 67-36]